MITIYKTTAEGLEQINEYESGCWIHVVSPRLEEVEQLVSWFNIPSDFLTDPLDVDERARVEREEGSTLILLRTPKREAPDADIPFTTLPVGIILTQNVMITVSLTEVDVIREVLGGRTKNFSTPNRTGCILTLFLRTALLFMRYLKEINRMSNEVEKNLHKALKNEQLIKLLNLEKSLVFFITSLRSNALMMEKFNTIEYNKMTEDERDIMEEVMIENKQAIEMTNIYTTILSGMMDAFASVISNNLNVVMKLLTTVTIILMIPTLVASVYGMNVELPYQHSPYAFLITMAISGVLAAIGILIFWRKEFF
ncbi:magnesium transporter [Methanolinea mesophila]|uniref:magnesium transporter CorA family protein n=1 Tax=Methanolinea mesophila TaxID=547055 RepID=UPI001AE7AF00|nr:magnesium transporter CorA family protein [Methanolinea mesophila]MBP1928839.1 magnesium transporter [Methanolinea mesophila]